MDINYIILAHKNPEQLNRLVNSLQEDQVRFYIHIDKNVQIKPFYEKLKKYSNIYFLNKNERKPGIWGDIGIVKGTLNAIKRIVDDKRNGYTVLLTGQDYPLQSSQSICRFFENSSYEAYITLYPLPNSILEKGGMQRITKYKINKATKRGYFLLLPSIFDKDFYSMASLGKLNYLRKTGKWTELKKIFLKRRHPKYLEPYAGGVYWAMSIKVLEKILKYITDHPDYLEYHRYSLCADEIFFHSIIAHLNNIEPLEINRSLTYVNWERPTGPLPVTFKMEDFEELKEASKDHLFARKFDVHMNEEILDEIDNNLLT